MDLVAYVEKSQLKKKLPVIKPGFIVAVHQRIKEGKKERIQIFKGIVIKVKGGYGINGSFTVRRVASGVGVEKTFLFHSPVIEKIVVLKQAKVRRAKLYYLRGLFGKRAKLNLKDESGEKVEELINEIVGEEPVEKDSSSKTQVSSGEGEEKDSSEEKDSKAKDQESSEKKDSSSKAQVSSKGEKVESDKKDNKAEEKEKKVKKEKEVEAKDKK